LISCSPSFNNCLLVFLLTSDRFFSNTILTSFEPIEINSKQNAWIILLMLFWALPHWVHFLLWTSNFQLSRWGNTQSNISKKWPEFNTTTRHRMYQCYYLWVWLFLMFYSWPDFEGRCASPRISFCTLPETPCTFPSKRLIDISKWKCDKFLPISLKQVLY
jgi:hypothetical protein